MAQRRRLLVVSNRGPVSYERDVQGARVAKRGAGGLVNALRSLVEHHDVMWIASAMTDEDRVVAREGDTAAGIRFVSPDARAYNLYYNVVANPTLWFLQHYMWGLPYAPDIDHDLHDAWFKGYVPVNEAFAESV